MAPEILDTESQVSEYNEIVDVWSAGYAFPQPIFQEKRNLFIFSITCSVMLSGDITFFASTVEVQGESVSFEGPCWSEISKEGTLSYYVLNLKFLIIHVATFLMYIFQLCNFSPAVLKLILEGETRPLS